MKRIKRGIACLCVLMTALFLLVLPTSAVEYPTPEGVTSALLYNLETGTVLLETEGDASVAPSDTMRMMTALVAYRKLQNRLSDTVTLTADMVEGASGYRLQAGDQILVGDLFALMLVRGANDATQALAVLAGSSVSSFVSMMNERAAELKMESTRYTGIYPIAGDRSYTTAQDVVKMAAEFYGNSFLADLAADDSVSVTVNGQSTTARSRCALDYRNGHYDFYRTDIKGMAVNDTASTLVAGGKFEDLSYIAVIFGAQPILWNDSSATYDVPRNNAYATAITLLDFARAGFESKLIFHEYEIMGELPVRLSRQADTVAVVPAKDVRCFLPVDNSIAEQLSYKLVWDVDELDAPVKLAQKVGKVQIFLNGTVIEEVDLVTNHTVSKSLLSELAEFLGYVLLHPVTLILLAALIGFIIWRLIYSARAATAAEMTAMKVTPDEESKEE